MADKPHPKSLRNIKVGTVVEPKDKSVDKDTAEKIAKNLKKVVKEALKKNDDKPSDEQVGAAMGKVSEEKHADIGVVIIGTRGEDGEEEAHAKGTGGLTDELPVEDIDDD